MFLKLKNVNSYFGMIKDVYVNINRAVYVTINNNNNTLYIRFQDGSSETFTWDIENSHDVDAIRNALESKKDK